MNTIKQRVLSLSAAAALMLSLAACGSEPAQSASQASSQAAAGEERALVFSQDQVLGVIYPGQTIWWASPAGNGTAPDSVEFTVAEPDDYNVRTATGDASVYSFSNLSEAKGGFGLVSFTGDVTLEREGDEEFDMGSVAIVVVLRDGDGKVVCGSSAFVDNPSPGSSRSFEVSCFNPPDYASYEVYALTW